MKRQSFAARCNDDALRLASSSGGVFTLLAEAVIEDGGVVFGAAFDRDLQVVHTAITYASDLERLRGSKYVKSRIGDSYKQARAALESGKTVLFTGSPCQIAGLKAFLKKDYVNLITQDLACHGAPPDDMWEFYLLYREGKAGFKPIAARFRDKSTGWASYSLTIDFADGSRYSARVDQDPYMKAFLRDYTLSTACYNCAHKGLDRQSDITLADLWGADYTCPALQDGKGTSAVLIHTEKGLALWEKILPRLTACAISEKAITDYNPSMLRSAKLPKDREAFLDELWYDNFGEITDKYFPPPTILQRLWNKLLRGARKVRRLFKP